MLTEQLRELEWDGLVTRTVHQVVPPHVEYALTDLGKSAFLIVESLRAWGTHYLENSPKRPSERLAPVNYCVSMTIPTPLLKKDQAEVNYTHSNHPI